MRRAGVAAGVVLALLAGLLVLQLMLNEVGHERDATQRAQAPDGFPIGVSFGDRLVTLPQDQLDDALDDVVALNANWIRIDVSWARVQPTAAGAPSWTAVDRVVDAARARDLKVLGILTYTPAWARRPGCGDFACPPRSAAEFARFAGTTAQRYRGRVAAYEIWNEPNLDRFWHSPDPAAYGALLRATVPALRRADRSATLLLGGLAANPDGARVVPATRFLVQSCAGGACTGLDGVAYHPYTFPLLATDSSPSVTAWQRITRPSSWGAGLAEVVARGLPGDGRVWITEYGAPTGGDAGDPPAGCSCVSEARQADIVASGIRAARTTKAVGAVFVYTWKDLAAGGDPEDHFGLRRSDGSEKPAFSAFASAAGS